MWKEMQMLQVSTRQEYQKVKVLRDKRKKRGGSI